MNKESKTLLTLLSFLMLTGYLIAADLQKNSRSSEIQLESRYSGIIYDDNYKWHKIGTLWNRVTNWSYLGDDAYNNRTPSCDWPGGSGNSYLYRGTIWLSGTVDGVYHITKGDDHEFASLDSVHLYTGVGTRSEEDTYTRYYDVVAPLADANHFPLGLEITEQTYAWSSSYADDFVIYEYTIKNVGIDADGDSIPDTPRTIDDFYFTIRLDGDVSKMPDWGAEYRFSNIDDHAIANGIPWDWVEQFPDMTGRDHGLTDEDIDSSMVIMFDGDNTSWPAYDDGPDNDFGNPGVDGKFQSPGFLGIKILKTEPYLPPYSYHICHIYNDPVTDDETWDFLKDPIFEPILVDSDGNPFPHDYRGIITFGPLDSLAAGDSVVVTTALGVGCDPDSGGVYSLVELVKIMDVAQFIVDNDFSFSAEALSPAAPFVDIDTVVVDGITSAVKVQWDSQPVSHPNFHQFLTWKGQRNALGSIDWKPLGLGTYTLNDSVSWPPPINEVSGKYELIDTDVINGLVYYYSVQAATDSINEPIPFGVISTNIQDANSMKVISPSNPVANSLDNIKVVPNPYIGSGGAYWNNPRPGDSSPWEHRLQFTNLPADATIKIFTLDGDLVDELRTDETVIVGGEFNTASLSVAEWDLMTRNDQEAAPGLYLYVVDSRQYGQKVGKFVIIR
ncbi:MAG: hypothetical protein H8E14_13950 [Candidatus Marinimicrobia bacterium]|nr:hypothetical protein [Candidatus Neomarinimicrobiota bacterium]